MKNGLMGRRTSWRIGRRRIDGEEKRQENRQEGGQKEGRAAGLAELAGSGFSFGFGSGLWCRGCGPGVVVPGGRSIPSDPVRRGPFADFAKNEYICKL